MSTVDSGLGWACDSDYYFDASQVLVTFPNDDTISKANAGACLGAAFKNTDSPANYGVILASPNQAAFSALATNNSGRITLNTTTEIYDGVTWYVAWGYTTTSYSETQSYHTQNLVLLETPIISGSTHRAQGLIQESGYVVTAKKIPTTDWVKGFVEGVEGETATRVGAIYDSIDAITETYGSKNVLHQPFLSQSKNGITFTANYDGTITLSGTATADTEFLSAYSIKPAPESRDFNYIDPTKKYIFTVGVPYNENTANFTIKYTVDGTDYFVKNGETLDVRSLIGVNYIYIRYFVPSGVTPTNATIKPMLRDYRIIDDTYVPFTLTTRRLTQLSDHNTFTASGSGTLVSSWLSSGTAYWWAVGTDNAYPLVAVEISAYMRGFTDTTISSNDKYMFTNLPKPASSGGNGLVSHYCISRNSNAVAAIYPGDNDGRVGYSLKPTNAQWVQVTIVYRSLPSYVIEKAYNLSYLNS